MLTQSPKMSKKIFFSSISINALIAVPNLVMAQEVKTEEKAKEAKPVEAKDEKKGETVTITGQKPVNRIDKQVYDVKDDVATQTGTATEALNKVPSVTRLGSGARKISRKTSPVKYWALLAFQGAFGVLALLIWLNIIEL